MGTYSTASSIVDKSQMKALWSFRVFLFQTFFGNSPLNVRRFAGECF